LVKDVTGNKKTNFQLVDCHCATGPFYMEKCKELQNSTASQRTVRDILGWYSEVEEVCHPSFELDLYSSSKCEQLKLI